MINSPGTYDDSSVGSESFKLCLEVALAMVTVNVDVARNVIAMIRRLLFFILILS
jgi:hypothetical protein